MSTGEECFSPVLKELGRSAGVGDVNRVLTAESSLSIPPPETPLIHFLIPDCSVAALTRLICSASPAAHVCHYSDEAVTLRIYSPFSSFVPV